jgi:hypothetical protein
MSTRKSFDIIRELESGEEIKVCTKIASTVSTLLQNWRSDVIRSREKRQCELEGEEMWLAHCLTSTMGMD